MRTISILTFFLLAATIAPLTRGEDTEQAAKQRETIRKKMKAAAKGKAFTDAVKQIAAATGSEAKPLETEEDETGGFVFTTTHAKAEELLKTQRAPLLAKGVFLFRHQTGHGMKIGNDTLPDEIALLPTKDKYEVLAAVETEGANSKRFNPDILAFLKDIEKAHPIDLSDAGPDYLAGTFTKPIPDAEIDALAKKLHEFDPDIEVVQQTRNLKKGQLWLWWD